MANTYLTLCCGGLDLYPEQLLSTTVYNFITPELFYIANSLSHIIMADAVVQLRCAVKVSLN